MPGFDYSRGLKGAFKEFIRNTNLNGYKYLNASRASARFFWICVHVSVLLVSSYLIYALWVQLMDNPIFITVEKLNYPVGKVQFPSMSVCNNNKISRKRITKVVDSMSKAMHLDRDRLLDKMKMLGGLFDYETVHSTGELFELQSILESYYGPTFSIRGFLKTLTPDCRELITNCTWKAQNYNCSELFHLRLTYQGFCCTMNYVKQTEVVEDDDSQKDALYNGEKGYINGLNLVVKNDVDDYFYTSISALGVMVDIALPEDYPDIGSGSLNQNLLGIDTENFIEIIPTIVLSHKNVRPYSIEKRRCIFRSEKQTMFGNYSQSDCLVNCKVRSVKVLCECKPFMIPSKKNDSDIICSLMDLQCLDRCKDKLLVNVPYAEDITDKKLFEKDIATGFSCDERCYPNCDSVMYGVKINTNDMNTNRKDGDDTYTIIHVYYMTDRYVQYRKDVVFYWFEILATFGGLFGLTIGFSLISAVDFIIYMTYKSFIYSRKPTYPEINVDGN